MASRIHIAAITLVITCVCADSVNAADLYVDNFLGSNSYNGQSDRPQDDITGPVRSIRRALKLARRGDSIHIKDNGRPYYEDVSMSGLRHSGVPGVPIRLEGGGAVVSGARPLPLGSWKHINKLLYKVTPRRKGYYQLLLDGKVVTEQKVAPDALVRPKVEEQKWVAWQGSIYYQAVRGEDPDEMPFEIAARGVGLTMYRVHDVIVSDITFQHFRLDGINLHDQCSRVFLKNVKGLENGRAGIAVGGTSLFTVHDSEFTGNRDASMLLTESGGAQVKDTVFSTPPIQR